MLKQKYLHSTNHCYRDSDYKTGKGEKKRLQKFYTDIYNNTLPFREPMAPKERYCWNSRQLNTRPLYIFLNDKAEKRELWSEVYSEILSKTKPHLKWIIRDLVRWYVDIPVYDENYVPNYQACLHSTRPMVNNIFIDLSGRLRILKDTDEVNQYALSHLRREKLKKIMS